MIRPAPPQYLRDRRARLVGAASAGVIVWSLASAASALPSGGVIYDPSGSGSGTTITTGSSSVTVDQAGDRVVIDWSTFNIASGESVTFNQPNANAIAFNRVDPTAFTTIDGSLAANGGVWLFSPGGLLFGANAQVNVGSFVGSTAQLQDTDIAAALSGDTVTLSPLANRNGATLTVTNGAQLTATNGFMVLQGETIVQNGSVVSNSDAVWYGVAEGAKITMDTTGAAPDLVDATVQAVAGRGRPSFTQGSTGVTTAHTWVGVSTPGGVESGWQTVINLGGATTAQGAKPGTQDGVVILTGADGVVDLTTSDVHLATAGVLNSVYGVNIDVNSATLDGDIGASGVVAVDLMATDDVVINGDIYGTLVSLTSTGGDLTIGSGSDIEAGQFSAGAVLKMYAYGDLTIASGATVTSLSDMILSVTDAGGTLTVSGSVYAFGTGSNAGNATALFSSGDLEITAGGVVDGAEGVILSSGGPTTISGTVDSTSSTTVLTGDLTVTGTGVVDSDGSTILASYAAGPATMTIDGSVHSGGDTSIRAMVNGADLTIDGTGTVLAAGSLTVSADRDITVDADVAGNVVDIYAGRDFHQTGGTIGFESGLYIAADGDIRTDAGALIEASPAADHSIVYLDAFDSMYLAGDIHGEYVVNLLAQGGNGPGVLEIDGVIYASDRIRVYQDSGEIHLGANADLYTGEPVEYGYPGIWIQGEGAITADAGASIRTPGAYTGAYVNIVANGANGGIDLAADIQSGNVTIQANFDAVDITLSGGSITATDLVAIEGKGNVNVLDGVTIGADYLNIYVNGAAGSQIIFDGDVTTTETIAIRNDDGDVTIGANANLHANSDASTDNGGPLGYQNDTIEITGQDITTVAGSQITVGDAGEPYRGTVQIHSDATNAGGPTQVSLGGAIQAETVGVQVDDGSLDISGSIHTYGDLTFDVSRYFTGDANGDLVTRGYVSISAGLGVDFDGDIHSGGDISIVASGVDADLSLGGMLETPGSIDLSAGGDLSLGAAAYLHSDTDSANANGINIYAYGVVTTAAGSTIVAGQTSDATADVVITAFGHGGGDVEPLDLGGDIYAQGLALSTPYGSIHLRDGDLHVEDSLAIYAYDHFIMDAPASIHAGGDVAITAYYGVQADGAIYAGGDVYLGVYGADADISLGTIEADGSIYISATGDIVLNSGGYLRADANYDGDTDYIYLSAYGRVVTGAGSSMMVGKAGYYTGNVYIGAGASDDPGGSAAGSAIDLSGDIHAGDLLLYADYGSIYLRDGDVVIDQGFDAVSYYDFRIGSNATVHTGGGVDVTAYGEIYAPGSIYADADVLIRGLSTDSNVTVGNIETAGRLSVVNTAAGGDVIVDGYLHSNSDGVGSGDLYLTSDGAVVVDGRLVVGQDSNSVAGAVQITAADDSVSGASAIDLTGDIYADDLYLNTTSGSIHIGPGRIEITSDFSVGAPEDFVTDAGSIIDAYDVLIEAGNNITLDGDIYSQTDIALNRTGSGAGDVTVGGLLHAADVVDIDNRGPGDVVLDGAGIIANSDGDSLGGINITSHLGQVRGASGLLQSGPSSNAYAGYINVTAYGPDGPTSSSIDLAMYMYADDINLSATNGSVHIGEGYVVAGDLFYVYAAGDITIDPYAMIVSGGALELHGAADITVEGDLYANSLILIDSGGDLTINDAAHADSIHLLATGDVSIGADADVIAFYDFTLTMRGAGDVDIYGLVSADYIDISNPYGDIVIGGEVSGGYDAYDPVVHISASGDLTVTDTGYVNGAGDIVLETTGANSALTVDGLISGAGIQLRGSHDIFVGGYIYGGEAITIVSDATNQNDGEIVIDGLVSSLQGISIVNRNTGGVTFDANATVYTYYYVGNCVECYGYRTGSGGTTSLGGLDGDIYIYSAGQVVTVAGSVIDATQGVGSDVGLVVIRAAGSDNATTSAIDLSGDIISYQTYLYADNGSVHQAAGTIFATDQVYINAAGDFLQDAGASIDGNSNGNAYVDIFAGGDIDLSGSIYGYYVRIEANGPTSNIDISGYVYATDALDIYNYGGDIHIASTGELYVGSPVEASYPEILVQAAGSITTDSGSLIHTLDGEAGGSVRLRADADTGDALNLAGDISSGDVTLTVNGTGRLLITDGNIEALGDVYLSSYGQVHVTGGVIDAGESVFVTSSDDMLLAGSIYAQDLAAHIYAGEANSVPGSAIVIDGLIETANYVALYNEVGAVELHANAEIYSNTAGTLNQNAPAVRIEGESVTSEAGSLIHTPSNVASSEVLIQAHGGSGTTVDLQGDIDAGVVIVNTFGDGGMVIGGDIRAQTEIILHSAGFLTLEDTSDLYADDLVALYADRDLLIAGDVHGRYIRANIYGGEAGTGVDGASIRVDGNLYAEATIELYNGVGDVEIGAGAALYANLGGYDYQTYQSHFVQITGENIITGAGSLITVGADGEARKGDIYLHTFNYYGDPTLMDLSGDIDTESVTFVVDNGSMHVREGTTTALAAIGITVDGYLDVDADGAFVTGGSFSALSYGGMTFDGDVSAHGISLIDLSLNDLTVGGDLISTEEIYIHGDGDVRLGAGANLVADSDNYSGPDDFHYVLIDADGQISTAAGSSIRVGPTGAPTGDVTLYTRGSDGGGFSALDLSGDIEAQHLYVYAQDGSIRLRDGVIDVTEDLDMIAGVDFIMDGLAAIYTDGNFDAVAAYNLSVAGRINAGNNIGLTRSGAAVGAVTVNGYLYAGYSIDIRNDGFGDVVLGGPTILADVDGDNAEAFVNITASGGRIEAPGGGEIRVGLAGDEHGSVYFYSGGTDTADGAAIELAGMSLTAGSVWLNAEYGSIGLYGSTGLYSTGNVVLDAAGDVVASDQSLIDADASVQITAHHGMDLAGTITAGGDVVISLPAGAPPGQHAFTAGSGDIVLSGVTSADGNIQISNYSGDIYLSGELRADADGVTAPYSGDGVRINIGAGQFVTGADSLIQAGPDGTPTNYVSIISFGSDGADYSSVDLSGDISAGSLIMIGGESIHLRGGAIDVAGSAFIGGYGYFLMDQGATVTAGSEIIIEAAQGIQSYGDLTAGGYIDITLDPDAVFGGFVAGAGDIVLGGNITANADISVHNYGLGDIYLDGTAALQADADSAGADGSILIDSLGQVVSAAGSTMLVGEVGATTGGVSIYASGSDNASYSSVDLSGDINASSLLVTADGSIHLADGAISVSGDAFFGTYADFLMDDPASISAGGDVDIVAVRSVVSMGDIDSGGDIYFHLDPDAYFYTAFTAGPGDLVVGVAVTADGSINIINEGSGDIYVDGTAAIVADADSTGGAYIDIVSQGQVISAAGSSMLVGANGATTGDVNIYAYGGDSAAYSSIDLSGDIEAAGLRLRGDGSIHLADGDIVLTDDLLIGTYLDFLMDAPATITTDGDVSVTAARSIVSLGEIDGGGDIYFHLDPNFTFDFAAGPGDLVVGGAVSADGSIDIVNEGAGDVYIDGTALLVADADSTGGPDHIAVTSDGQIISAAGSSMTVGSAGATTGDVLLTAGGADNPDYSAIDLSGDIDADTLTLDAANGSIHLADGTITVVENLEIINGFHIVMDAPATINGAADVAMDAALSLQVNGTIYSGGDIDLHLSGPNAQDLTIGGDLTADGSISAVNAGSGLLTLFASGSLDAGSFAYLQANGDVTVDGSVTAAGNVLAYSDSDIEVGGSIDAGSGVTLEAGRDIRLSGDVHTDIGAVRATAEESLYQYAGSVSGGSDIFLTASYDMVLDGDVTAGRNLFVTLYGGEGGDGDIDINGSLSADGDMAIDNRAEDVNLGADASLRADADGDGGADAQLSITAGDQIYSAAGSSIHVGDGAGRTGFVTLEAGAVDSVDGPAIELSGDIDAGSVGIYAYDGSVEIADGSVRADNDIAIYAGEFFILGEDAVVSGAESRTDGGFDKPSGVLVYAPYDVGPGVGIVASDVDIQGQVVSGDAILIAAYNVSGGEVTVGGADPANLGTGFTLSNLEFQNLSADSIIVVAGQGAGEASSGYDLHVADLDIDPANVGDVWLGTQEDLIVEGDVSPTGEGVNLHLGFAVLGESDGGLAADEFLVGFVPTNVLISGNLGTVDNPFGSVTLIAQGDILMGSDAFMNAALGDAEFSAQEQSDNYDSPGEGHIFIASDVLQMATPGRILQQNTGSNVEFGGLAIGLPQAGQELIFVPDQIDGESFGTGAPLNFASGPTRIELFGYFYGEGGEIVAGFDAAQVDNLLDPDLLIGEYFINSCQFYGECGSEDDVPVFHDPFPPVEPQLDADDTLSFFSGFPFEEPDDEDDEDQVQGEPVTGSGNEDLWTMKPTGVRP